MTRGGGSGGNGATSLLLGVLLVGGQLQDGLPSSTCRCSTLSAAAARLQVAGAAIAAGEAGEFFSSGPGGEAGVRRGGVPQARAPGLPARAHRAQHRPLHDAGGAVQPASWRYRVAGAPEGLACTRRAAALRSLCYIEMLQSDKVSVCAPFAGVVDPVWRSGCPSAGVMARSVLSGGHVARGACRCDRGPGATRSAFAGSGETWHLA